MQDFRQIFSCDESGCPESFNGWQDTTDNPYFCIPVGGLDLVYDGSQVLLINFEIDFTKAELVGVSAESQMSFTFAYHTGLGLVFDWDGHPPDAVFVPYEDDPMNKSMVSMYRLFSHNGKMLISSNGSEIEFHVQDSEELNEICSTLDAEKIFELSAVVAQTVRKWG